MLDMHMFKAQVGMFEPTALLDHNACIHDLEQHIYRQGDYLEAIPPFQCIDLGALVAQTVGARTAIPNLDMPDEEFGLFRWYCIDNAQIRLFLPRGVAKFDLKNIQVPFDYKTIQRDPNLVSTEIAIWEDNRPSIEAINGMDYDLQAVRIIAMGYRFHTVELEKDVIAKIKAGMTACTDVIASGYGATA